MKDSLASLPAFTYTFSPVYGIFYGSYQSDRHGLSDHI
jgi:hypothetical protein